MMMRDILKRNLAAMVTATHNLCYQYRMLDEEEVNLRQVLLHMNTHVNFFKQNKQLLPEAEFNLLIEVMENISHEKQNEHLREYNVLLAECLHHLIVINDLLNERVPEKKAERFK